MHSGISIRCSLALMMETLKTNWQLLNTLRIYTNSTGQLRYVSLSMIAVPCECESKILFSLSKIWYSCMPRTWVAYLQIIWEIRLKSTQSRGQSWLIGWWRYNFVHMLVSFAVKLRCKRGLYGVFRPDVKIKIFRCIWNFN